MKFRTGSKGSEGAKHFIRLKDGDSVTGVLRGDLHEFYTHWVGQGTVLCPRKSRVDTSCKLCNEGQKPAFRFRVNMITKENDQLVAKIFESGWTVYEALGMMNAEYPMEKTTIKISRKGSGKNDTVYSVLPLRGGEISETADKQLDAIKLHDLSGKEEQPREPGEDDLPY